MTSYTKLLGIMTLGAMPVMAADPVVELEPVSVVAKDFNFADGWSAGGQSGSLANHLESSSRTVRVVDAEALYLSGAQRIEDILWQLPGASAPARFGSVGVPNLRGDAAELLFNGQRRADNLFGVPPSFAAVASLELQSGLPGLVSGPGKRGGGSLNLVTLQPVLNQTAGNMSLRLGSWVPDGGSFLTTQAQLQANVATGERHALTAMLNWQDDETFYHSSGGRDDRREAYLSWLWQPDRATSLQLNFLHDDLERPQTLGVNRPWQGLVDGGNYLAGTAASGGAEPGLLGETPLQQLDLPRDRVLLSPGDTGSARVHLAQVIFRKQLAADITLHQLVLLEDVDRSKRHAFYYAEQTEQLTLDSQTLLQGGSLEAGSRFAWQSGLHLRHEDRSNLSNYWNEFTWAYDLSADESFNAYERFPEAIVPGFVTDADGNQWYLPGSPLGAAESTDSTLQQAGVFGRVSWMVLPQWRLDVGLRLDRFELEASEPVALTRPDRWSDSRGLYRASGQIALHREFNRGRVHLLFAKMSGVAGNTVGDGLNLYSPGQLWSEDFENSQQLWELGGDQQIGGRAQLRWSAWHQKRTRAEFFGSNDIVAKGAEADLRVEVRTGTRISVNVAYLDARYDNAAPAEFGGGSLWNVYAAGAGPEGAGTGLGYLGGFLFNSMPPGDYRLSGTSRWSGALSLQQRLSERWMLQIWGTVQSRQRGNLAAEYFIPSQTEWNLSLNYERPDWDLQIVARNLLDADNWRHNGDTFFDQMLVSRNLPLRVEGRIRWRF